MVFTDRFPQLEKLYCNQDIEHQQEHNGEQGDEQTDPWDEDLKVEQARTYAEVKAVVLLNIPLRSMAAAIRSPEMEPRK